MRKIKGIVDAVGDSDVSFGNFVDKGTLSRIAALENSLQAVSETSEDVKGSLSGLKQEVATVVDVLKQAGAIKFPATFENLFVDIQDQTDNIQRAKDSIKDLKADVQGLKRLFDEVGADSFGNGGRGRRGYRPGLWRWRSGHDFRGSTGLSDVQSVHAPLLCGDGRDEQ